MKEIRRFPSISTLHRLSGQGRKEPSTVTLFKGWTRLTMDDHGEMHGNPMQGFYAAETQMLSHYEMRVNGSPVRHRLAVQLAAYEWSSNGAVLGSADEGNLPDGTLPKGSIEVRLLRRIGLGWAERIIIKNNGSIARHVEFELSLVGSMRDSQFEDEMKRDKSLPKRGLKARKIQDHGRCGLRFEKYYGVRKHAPTEEFKALYGEDTPREGQEVSRSLEILIDASSKSGRFEIRLCPGQVNRILAICDLEGREELVLELKYEPIANGYRMSAPSLLGLEPLPCENQCLPENGISIETSHSTLNLILGQVISDLNSLELPVYDAPTEDSQKNLSAFIAGIPRYVGLFGRDNLITAWQSAIFHMDLFEPVLARLAALQGVQREDWRDEELNRLPHEQRINPCSQIGKTNREIYYGDVTSTPFWILALASLYRWKGDIGLIRKHAGTLRKCLQWVRTRIYQGGGYIYYAPALPHHPDENRNQAWKDSGDAIVDEDGRIRVPPLALIEIQAYAYQALIEASELLETLGDDEKELQELRSEAEALKIRVNKDFWVPEQKFFALALDQDGKPLRAKASNIGHALATSVLDEDKVGDIVQGLMEEDMFSGWGIRTLSDRNPAYDPFSYHRCSVLPVENAFIADGLSVRGYHVEAEKVITAQLGLAAMFEHLRLPEVISGHTRDAESPVPGLYSYANLLQAWSVSAIAQYLQILLGIRPRADHGVLYLDPHLPEWLSWVELKNVEFHGVRLHIRFWRTADGKSHWNVVNNPGRAVVRSGSPIPFGEKKRAA